MLGSVEQRGQMRNAYRIFAEILSDTGRDEWVILNDLE
jgi:hypothetical protein